MQSGFNDKIVYKYTPCKAPGPCYDYNDYDPCESSDDITEKDLAVLLKEEQLKLQKEKEKLTAAPSETAGAVKTAGAAAATKTTTEAKDLEDAATALSVAQGEKTGTQNKSICKPGVKTANKQADEEIKEKPAKKRSCKKFIKNPFFTNRFKFSSDFPPPPPGPPQQFLPLVEEVSSKDRLACLKRRKKCGKKMDDAKVTKASSKVSEDIGENVVRDENVEKYEKDESPDLESDEKFSSDTEFLDDDFEDSSEGEARKIFKGKKKIEDEEKPEEKKKRCAKKGEKPPCRKKDSEIPITLQPRQIPAVQKDLPDTSPMHLPEVRRQLKMSCHYECRPVSSKKKCKDKNK